MTVILDEVYGDAAKFDKLLWQVDYHAGMLLLEKYNRPEALDAFDDALSVNPRAAEAFVGEAETDGPRKGGRNQVAALKAVRDPLMAARGR